MQRWLIFLLLVNAGPVAADETVLVCYGYGCLVQENIHYSESRLQEIGRRMNAAAIETTAGPRVDAENERKTLSAVIGQLYAWAGEQSDVKNDRGGNYADGSMPGKMDCIDHSTSTTRLLKLLEGRGDLRWHRVVEPEVRHWAYVFPAHYSAVIEEKLDGAGEPARFAVDSWFVDNGEPAVILPLDDWKKGAGPDV